MILTLTTCTVWTERSKAELSRKPILINIQSCLNPGVYKSLDQIESSFSCSLDLLDPNCHVEEEKLAVFMNQC